MLDMLDKVFYFYTNQNNINALFNIIQMCFVNDNLKACFFHNVKCAGIYTIDILRDYYNFKEVCIGPYKNTILHENYDSFFEEKDSRYIG